MRLTNEQQATFAQICNGLTTGHNGMVISNLLWAGLIYEFKGRYYPMPDIGHQWRQWNDLEVDEKGDLYLGVEV